MKNKIILTGLDKMRASIVNERLVLGVVEYYSKNFSILCQWDGKLTFTLMVEDRNKQIIEESIITHELADREQDSPLIWGVWDKTLDEFERLKTKHILDL